MAVTCKSNVRNQGSPYPSRNNISSEHHFIMLCMARSMSALVPLTAACSWPGKVEAACRERICRHSCRDCRLCCSIARAPALSVCSTTHCVYSMMMMLWCLTLSVLEARTSSTVCCSYRTMPRLQLRPGCSTPREASTEPHSSAFLRHTAGSGSADQLGECQLISWGSVTAHLCSCSRLSWCSWWPGARPYSPQRL